MNTSHPTPEDPAGPEGSGAGPTPAPSAPTGTHPTEPLPRPAEDQAAGEAPGGRPGNRDPGSPGPRTAPQPGAPAPPPQDLFNRIRSHGITRGTNRWVGGVCSGIADRLGIDPVIVRGVFIVLTLFAGIGVLLYGIGWALLPEPDGRIHVQEAGAGHWASGMTGALIATVLGFSGLGGGFWGGDRGFAGFLWACFWLTLVVLVVYLVLDKGRRSQGAGAATYAVGLPDGTAYGTTGSAVPAEAASFSGPYAAPYAAPGSAPYQGPYGDGPYGSGAGGALPPPASNRPRPAGPGTPVVAVTAGLALLLGGGLKLLDAASMINLGESPDAVVWASAAAVLGLGIVFAGARGKTSGILGFMAVVALLVGAAFNMGHNSTRFDFEEVSWTPVSVEDATNGLDVTGAHGWADLTVLDLDTPLADDVVVPLDVTASNLTLIIPDNVPVEISADMTMGNISERGSDRGGISTRESSYNTELPGAALVVTIDGTFSNVTIQEGN